MTTYFKIILKQAMAANVATHHSMFTPDDGDSIYQDVVEDPELEQERIESIRKEIQRVET